MPVAVITETSKHFDLKTCPPDGFVVIKRMSHGQKLTRKGMTKMQVNAQRGKKDVVAEIEMMQKQVSLWEFSNLIVEHNLTDANGVLLNFKNAAHVESLDGRIGEEIDTYISEYNNFEAEAEDGDTDLGE